MKPVLASVVFPLVNPAAGEILKVGFPAFLLTVIAFGWGLYARTRRELVATASVFKGKPAPGAFTFCLSEGLVMQTGLIHGTGMSYLGSEIKIVSPVLVGDTLHVRVVITEKRETKKADRGIVTYRHEVLNHRGELVLEATIKRMIKRAAADSA